MNRARNLSAGVRRRGRRVVVGAALLVVAVCAAPAALAHSHVGVSIGVGNCWGCGYPAPPPVYYAPAYPPVYYPPAVYYAPPVYYGYTYGYAPYWSPRHGRGYYHPRHPAHRGHGGWNHGHGHYGHGHH